MTIKLAYIKERDGLVFLCDKEGKELWQVVPKRPTETMQKAGNLQRWKTAVFNPDSPYEIYKAMLSAAKVDVSAALVKVPERKRAPEEINALWTGSFPAGWNACLDEL